MAASNVVGIAITASKKASKPGYLAKLVLKNGIVEREFVERFKRNANNSGFRITLVPGEAVELRGSHWDGERFVIGTHWFIHVGAELPRMVNSDTAFDFVAGGGIAALEAPEANGLPVRGFTEMEQILPRYISTTSAAQLEAIAADSAERSAAEQAARGPLVIEHDASVPALVETSGGAFSIGQRVVHKTSPAKFGVGVIAAISGDTLTINFEKGGWNGKAKKTRMLAHFVESAS